MASITVNDLVIHRSGRLVVDGVSFAADPGEVCCLLGPNGAGKTTTLEALEGYLRPTSGSISVLGLDPARDQGRLAPSIGVMLQEGGLYPAMSPQRALRLFAAYYANPEDPADLLARVGLLEVAKLPAKRLSGGQRRRLALALALVGRPRVLFLDEPTAGVDPEGRLAVRAVINELRTAGVCVLLTTHELDEAERLADSLVLLNRGKISAAGRREEMLVAVDELRFAAPANLDLSELGHLLGAPIEEVRPGEYRLARPPDPDMVATIAKWLADAHIALSDLRAGRRRLEDLFLDLLETDPARVPGGQSASRTNGEAPTALDPSGARAGEVEGPAR